MATSGALGDVGARSKRQGHRTERIGVASVPESGTVKPTIHVIASCTDRKRLPVPPKLRLREIPDARPQIRAERWWRRLSTHQGRNVAAAELYGGDHWSVARSLPDVAAANGRSAQLWVASAGYGLVPANAPLRPYS